MTQVRLAPTSTSLNSGAITGAGTAHGALSDADDSSYVVYEAGETSLFGMADLTLPSGALLIAAQMFAKTGRAQLLGSSVQMRMLLNAGGNVDDRNVIVSWFIPKEVGGALLWGGIEDADVDAAACAISNNTIFDDLVVYELALQVTYLLRPTVTVDLPTGTINENRVTVGWTPVFDPQADATDSHYEIKIFSDAQYGAGGFSPGASTPTLSVDSRNALDLAIKGSRAGNTFTFNDILLDDTYRAYMRVAARDTPDHLSTWSNVDFVVDAPTPGIPTMLLSSDPDNGAIEIDLDDNTGDVTTTLFELQRSDDGGATWIDVRTTLGAGQIAPTAGHATISDYEAPNGAEVTYRTRAFNSATPSYSEWTEDTETWSGRTYWLKHATRPSLNLRLRVRSNPGHATKSNQGVFRVLGSNKAIVVGDVRGPDTGQLVIWTESKAERDALKSTLELQVPLLLQGPISDELPERWIAIGDTDSVRFVDKSWAPGHDDSLSWTEVERPTGPLEE